MGKVCFVFIKVVIVLCLEFIVVNVFVCFGEIIKKEFDDKVEII